jgi:hypothetical protein
MMAKRAIFSLGCVEQRRICSPTNAVQTPEPQKGETRATNCVKMMQ